MRLTDTAAQAGCNKPEVSGQRDNRGQSRPAGGKPANRAPAQAPMGGAMAAAFSKLKG